MLVTPAHATPAPEAAVWAEGVELNRAPAAAAKSARTDGRAAAGGTAADLPATAAEHWAPL